MFRAYFLDCVPNSLDRRSQFLGFVHTADVHEVDLGLVEEEVIMQARHFQPAGEGCVHGRRDLVLKNDRVAHHHRSVGCRRECGPGAKPGKRRQRHAVHSHGHVVP